MRLVPFEFEVIPAQDYQNALDIACPNQDLTKKVSFDIYMYIRMSTKIYTVSPERTADV
jgi:hypothetical protein